MRKQTFSPLEASFTFVPNVGYLSHKLKHVKLAAVLSDKKNQESEGLNNSSVVSYSPTIGLENEVSL